MIELTTIMIILGILSLLVTVVLSVLAYGYYKLSEKHELNLNATRKSYESLKKVNTTLEGLIKQKNNEIVVLKIEVDANVEQLGKEREDHTLRENQVKRIRDILEEDEGEE